ncbi:MAG: hypothetical protein J6Y94_00105, partial [Bacteriovoracaceae bacterium]|nr:hypothetical protein [Bacteriovoracaceae bacterium]
MVSNRCMISFWRTLVSGLILLGSLVGQADEIKSPPSSAPSASLNTILCSVNLLPGKALGHEQQSVIQGILNLVGQELAQSAAATKQPQRLTLPVHTYGRWIDAFVRHELKMITENDALSVSQKTQQIREFYAWIRQIPTNSKTYQEFVDRFVIFYKQENRLTLNEAQNAFLQTAGKNDLRQAVHKPWTPTLEIQGFYYDLINDIYHLEQLPPAKQAILKALIQEFQVIEGQIAQIMGKDFNQVLTNPSALKTTARKLNLWVADRQNPKDPAAQAAWAKLQEVFAKIKALLQRQDITNLYPGAQAITPQELDKFIGDFVYHLPLAKMILGQGSKEETKPNADITQWPIPQVEFSPKKGRPLSPPKFIYSIPQNGPKKGNDPIDEDLFFKRNYQFLGSQCNWTSDNKFFIDDNSPAWQSIVAKIKKIQKTPAQDTPARISPLFNQVMGNYYGSWASNSFQVAFNLSQSYGGTISVFTIYKGRNVNFNVSVPQVFIDQFKGKNLSEKLAQVEEYFRNIISYIDPAALATLHDRTLEVLTDADVRYFEQLKKPRSTINTLDAGRAVYIVSEKLLIFSQATREDANYQNTRYQNIVKFDGDLNHFAFQILYYVKVFNKIVTEQFPEEGKTGPTKKASNANSDEVFSRIHKEAKQEVYQDIVNIRPGQPAITAQLSNTNALAIYPDVAISRGEVHLTPQNASSSILTATFTIRYARADNTVGEIPITIETKIDPRQQISELEIYHRFEPYILRAFSLATATWTNEQKATVGGIKIIIKNIVPGNYRPNTNVFGSTNLRKNYALSVQEVNGQNIIQLTLKAVHRKAVMPSPKVLIYKLNQELQAINAKHLHYNLEEFARIRQIYLGKNYNPDGQDNDAKARAKDFLAELGKDIPLIKSQTEIDTLMALPEYVIVQKGNFTFGDRRFDSGKSFVILIYPDGSYAATSYPIKTGEPLKVRYQSTRISGTTFRDMETAKAEAQAIKNVARKITQGVGNNGLDQIYHNYENLNTPVKLTQDNKKLTVSRHWTGDATTEDFSWSHILAIERDLRLMLGGRDIPKKLINNVVEIIVQNPAQFKGKSAAEMALRLVRERQIAQQEGQTGQGLDMKWRKEGNDYLNLEALPDLTDISEKLIDDVFQTIQNDPAAYQNQDNTVMANELALNLVESRMAQGASENTIYTDYDCADLEDLGEKVTRVLSVHTSTTNLALPQKITIILSALKKFNRIPQLDNEQIFTQGLVTQDFATQNINELSYFVAVPG